jgi:hypothetical protein
MKQIIYFHRAHRMIAKPARREYLIFSSAALIMMTAILALYPALSEAMTFLALKCVSPSSAAATGLIREPFLFGPLTVPDMPGKFPSLELCFGFFLVSVAVIVIAPRTRMARPVAIWMGFAAGIGLISAVVFGFWPPYFPYYIQTFSQLYMKMEIGLWLFIPAVMSLAFLPLPGSLPFRLAGMGTTLLYMIAVGIVRYAFIIAILVRSSYLFMAFLYFVIGPFLDFVLVVGLYSFFASRISRKIRRGLGIWRWSY